MIAANQQSSTNQHSIYQSSAGPIQPNIITSSGIYNSSTMRRQPHPQGIYQQQQPQQHQQQQQQQQQIKPTSIPQETAIPNSNAVDSAMFERDKQIYRCSTLRQGGKFDPKYKPSILNCPLPEIPKDADPPPKKETQTKEQITANNYSKTLSRPPMKLPPPGKAIPPPKIDTTLSPPLKDKANGNQNILIKKQEENDKLPSPPNSKELISSKPIAAKNFNSTGQDESGINPNDESNYAVTEL